MLACRNSKPSRPTRALRNLGARADIVDNGRTVAGTRTEEPQMSATPVDATLSDSGRAAIHRANDSGRTPVVFIHGLWLLPRSWDRWAAVFEEAGPGLSAVSVAIDQAPFRGVRPLPISALKSASPVLRNPASRNRAVPLTNEQVRHGFRQRGQRGGGQAALRSVRGPGLGSAAVPDGDGQPEPVDRGQGRHRESGSRTAVDHLRRAGPHGAVGDRQCLVQASGAQPWGDRDREDSRSWARAENRQRLARDRRHSARVRTPFHREDDR